MTAALGAGGEVVLLLASCLGLTFVSAVVPWVNAELIVLSLVTLTHSATGVALIVVLATVGQMLGKCVVYWTGLRAGGAATPRIARAVARARMQFDRRLSHTIVLVLVSSIVGIPPFYAVTLVAGALKVRFGPFLAAGTAGRLVHFGIVALAPQWIAGWR